MVLHFNILDSYPLVVHIAEQIWYFTFAMIPTQDL